VAQIEDTHPDANNKCVAEPIIQLTIYTVVTSAEEVDAFTDVYRQIQIPQGNTFVAVDNTAKGLLLGMAEDRRISILQNRNILSLNANIKLVYENTFSYYYMRIDSDDIRDNLHLLQYGISPAEDADIITCHYDVITGDRDASHHLCSHHVGYLHEPLGSGLIVRRQLFQKMIELTAGLIGQDNFSLWLAYFANSSTIRAGDHRYIYKLDNLYSMSTNTSRIKAERSTLLSSLASVAKGATHCLVLSGNKSAIRKLNIGSFSRLVHRVFGITLFFSFGRSPASLLKIRFCRVSVLQAQSNSSIKEITSFVALSECRLLVISKYRRSFRNYARIASALHQAGRSLQGVMILGC